MDKLKNKIIRQMPLWALALAVATTGFALPSRAHAENPADKTTVDVTATIKAVDQEARTLTVRGDDGEDQVIDVGSNVHNFSTLKPGDKINLKYTESLLLDLQPEGDPSTYTSGMAAQNVAGSVKPGAIGSERTVITAKVTAVDPTNNTITLLGPKGNTMTFDVKNPARQAKLKTIKVGELIRATYDQSVAISVTPVSGS